MKLQLSDVREAGYCSGGAREFCARYDIDWRRLVREGLELDSLKHIEDPMLVCVVKRIEERHGR